MNEKDFFTGHISDLAERSYNNSMYTFTDFLGESELDMLMSMEKDISYAGLTLFGGVEGAGRCIARFGRLKDLGYEQDFPVCCLKAEPLAAKFAEDLTHRDYLGALMSLGIERQLLGDIMISGKTAYIFCLDHIAEYIIQSLGQIRHTSVKISVVDEVPEDLKPHLEALTVIASSERLDGVISKLFNLSRSQSGNLFSARKVFVNGRQCENTSLVCKPEDTVSVRGFGKFIYDGTLSVTGKGRFRIGVRIYR